MNRVRIAAILAAALGIGGGTAVLLVDDTAKHEGRRLTAYQDTGGVWTVCDGITGPAVIRGRTYTHEECDELMADGLIRHCRPVLEALVRPTHGEIVAWCDFAYNVGVRAAVQSTGMRLQQQGKRAEACGQMLRWVYVGQRDCRDPASNCRGIVTRRQAQYARCMSTIPQSTALLSYTVE